MKQTNMFINEDEWIHRYINKQLTAEESIEFESYILDKPELVEKLELDNLMQRSLRTLQNERHVDSANEGFWKPLYSNILAIASCSALFVVLGVNHFSKFESAASFIETHSPSIIYLESFRGDKRIFEVSFKRNEPAKIFTIDLPPNSNGNFNLSITREDKTEVFKSTLSPNANKELILILDRNALDEGSFRLNVIQDANILNSYELMVKHNE